MPGFRLGLAAGLILNLTHKVAPLLPSALQLKAGDYRVHVPGFRPTGWGECDLAPEQVNFVAVGGRCYWRHADTSACAVFGGKGSFNLRPAFIHRAPPSCQVGIVIHSFPTIPTDFFHLSACPLLQADVDGKTQQPTKVTNAES